MTRFYVWADGEYSDAPLSNKSDDYMIVTSDTPIEDVVKWCGESAANDVFQDLWDYKL